VTRIRIKDIAQIANVSVGTVDRVIHNRGEVSEATRKKIRSLLEEYNYQPDILASSLALKKPLRLAVVMPGVANEHSFWNLPRSGIKKAMEELSHYNLSVDSYYFNQFDRLDFKLCLKDFPYQDFQGVLFAPVFQKESVSFIHKCEAAGLPVILFNSLLDVSSIRGFVGQDAFQSGYVAARLIHYGLEKGRDLAILNMSVRTDHYAHIIEREKGFRAYFEAHPQAESRLLTFDLHGADDQSLRKELIQAGRNYNLGGFFVTNSRVYKVAEILAQMEKLRVRLVGYDLLPESICFLKNGIIDFLISQKPEEQAFRGLSSLFYLAAFQRQPEARQMLPIDIITSENLMYYQPKSHE